MATEQSCIPKFIEVHIENTNSCGYKCVMCPRDKQTRKIGYMTMDDWELVLDRIENFEGCFHLHGFGEALLDRKLASKIEVLKKKHPKARAQIITTLGVRVKDDHFEKLLKAGLDDLMVSMYGFSQNAYKEVHGFDGLATVRKNLELLSLAKKDYPDVSTIIKVPGQAISSSLQMAEPDGKKEFIQWATEKGFEIGYWPYVHNYGDGREYNTPNEEKTCPVINGTRRQILNITWDLNVIPCCYDFNSTIPFGNLREQTLEEVFSSMEYFRFILAHQNNDLSEFPVCKNCEKNDIE